MNTPPAFDKEYWTRQFSSEIGLGHVPYEELHLHYVDFGVSVGEFDITSPNTKTARQYVDDQLDQTEEAYTLMGNVNLDEINPMVKSAELNTSLEDLLGQAVDIIDSFPTEALNTEPVLLEAPLPQIRPGDLKYFDVDIKGQSFTVVINDHGEDFRIKDQIRHLINTTFFVEMRDPTTLTNASRVISYYQFVNAMPLEYDRNEAHVRIEGNLTTEFDGPRLDGMLS